MIITLTANPSIDRTMQLESPLHPGDVFRAVEVGDDVGGKGVNVARAVAASGAPAVAVLPADPGDPLVRGLEESGVLALHVPVGHQARVNISVVDPDGTTTKLNDPGHPCDAVVLEALREHLLQRSHGDDWVVLSGSLAPGTPARWYADLVADLRAAGRRVALDTSGAPLEHAVTARTLPHLVKPNTDELASISGHRAATLEDDLDVAVATARTLIHRGVEHVLLTLGSAGALLVDAHAAWHAAPPAVRPRSTVGAGDAALAGYLLAETHGLLPPERLRQAVAYGSAAAALPGTRMPTPDQIDRRGVVVTSIP